MSSCTVTRWTRYGKDRLYVTDTAGTKVGWLDLLTGHEHPETPEQATELRVAVQSWRAQHGTDGLRTAGAEEPARTNERPPPPESATAAATPAEQQPPDLPVPLSAVVVSPEPTASSPAAAKATQLGSVPFEDLAQRHAGAMAREQAVALKQAAPVRTFLARALGVHTDERAWRIGADGEEKVAAQLAKLTGKDPRWHFLHAVPVGENGSDIDHVVIGPPVSSRSTPSTIPARRSGSGGTRSWSTASVSPTCATAPTKPAALRAC